MFEACSIFSNTRDYSNILRAFHQYPREMLKLTGSESSWQSIKLEFSDSTLEFTALVRSAPGDQFSKIVLGMYNFVRHCDGSEEQKARIASGIARTEMILGVVAKPEFLEPHFEHVFNAARSIDGLIFNGSAILNASGDTLLERK